MNHSKEQKTNHDQKLRAYQLGMKYKESGMDEEMIAAKIEKQGIPFDLAKQVANDIMVERKNDRVKEYTPKLLISVLLFVLGCAFAVISIYVLPGTIILPVGLIFSGFCSGLMAYSKLK